MGGLWFYLGTIMVYWAACNYLYWGACHYFLWSIFVFVPISDQRYWILLYRFAQTILALFRAACHRMIISTTLSVVWKLFPTAGPHWKQLPNNGMRFSDQGRLMNRRKVQKLPSNTILSILGGIQLRGDLEVCRKQRNNKRYSKWCGLRLDPVLWK